MHIPKFVVLMIGAALMTLLIAATPAHARQAPTVTAQLLPAYPGVPAGGLAIGINNAGDVVGLGVTSEGRSQATLWRGGVATSIGTLCGTCLMSIAYDINEHDQIVGYLVTGDYLMKPFAHANGAYVELPLPVGFTQGFAASINNSGKVVGLGWGPNGQTGLMWPSPSSPPQKVNLSAAYGVDDAGVIAGTVVGACGNPQAAVIRDGVLELLDGGVDCTMSAAMATNAIGLVAGVSGGNAGERATIWERGSRMLFEPLAGFTMSGPAVNAINRSGDLLGTSSGSSSACSIQATAWLPEGTVALPPPSPYLSLCDESIALAINDRAQAVGVFFDVNGHHMPVLWTIDVVRDYAPPVVTVVANDDTIAPPNGKMIPVTFSGSITDETALAGASFNVIDEYGAVQPSGPITIAPSGRFSVTVMLEARRDPKDKDGRIYTFVVTASDMAGHSTSAAATAGVKAKPAK